MAILKNTADLLSEASANLPDNSTQEISPQDVREMVENIAFSSYNKITDAGLVGLQEFSTQVTYPTGKAVIRNNEIYVANKEVTPGAFNGTDWDILTLPAKQDNLVSGTNIKTINGGSILGSGNVSVQEVLVSGTNIKTINGSTILGSGDISVSDTTLFDGGIVLGANVSNDLAGFVLELAGGTVDFKGASGSGLARVFGIRNVSNTLLWDFRANGDIYQGAAASWYLNSNNLTYELGTNLLTFNSSRNSNGYIINKSGTSGFGLHVEVDNASTSSGGISVDANSSAFGLNVFSTNGNIISTYKYSGNDGVLFGNGAGFKARPLSVLGGDNGSNSLGSGRYVNAQFGLSSDGIELGFNSTNGGGVIWGKGKEIEIEATTVGIGYQSNQQASKLQVNGDIGLVDGMTAPSATVGVAKLYVDTSDGDLKIIFGDGTIKTIATDT